MMDDMEFDDAMENMLANPAKFAVDCCCGTLEESPGLGFEFGQRGVRVMEIGDGHDPVVDPYIWLEI